MRTKISALITAVAALAVAGCGGNSDHGAGAGLPKLTSRSIAATAPVLDHPVRVGVNPTAVAVSGSSVWVVNNGSGTVSRLDASSGRPIARPIRVGQGPRAVSVGESAVWVIAGAGDIVRIDPATSAARHVAHVDDATGLVAGRGGVWVTSRAPGRVIRLDPRTGRPDGQSIRVGHEPTDIVLAAGAVWVANSADGTLSRIDPQTRRVDKTVRVARRQVLGLTGSGDRLWAAKTDTPLADPIALVGVDARSGALSATALKVPAANPVRLAAGGGSVWVTDVGGLGPGGATRGAGLSRVLPAKPAIAGRLIKVAADPAGVAVGSGSVWVTSAATGTVSRIRL